MNYNLDIQKIADELDFDLEDVEMLLEVFLEGAEESLENLKNAIDTNDFDEIFNTAHAIKGSSANLTLMDISNLAKDIETNAREKNAINYLEKYELLKIMIFSIQS